MRGEIYHQTGGVSELKTVAIQDFLSEPDGGCRTGGVSELKTVAIQDGGLSRTVLDCDHLRFRRARMCTIMIGA